MLKKKNWGNIPKKYSFYSGVQVNLLSNRRGGEKNAKMIHLQRGTRLSLYQKCVRAEITHSRLTAGSNSWDKIKERPWILAAGSVVITLQTFIGAVRPLQSLAS